MKYKKSMYLILGLGVVVPVVTFSAISLSQHYSKKKTLSKADKIKFLNKIIAKINSQSKVPLLMSDYFDGNADKEKQEFIKKFKIYLTNSYGSSKFNIDDITSWIDFENIKAQKLKDNDKFSKLINFSIKIKYATQRMNINFVFYQSMASSSKNKQALLDKIKKEIKSKEGIYELTNFKKVAFKLVKEMGQLQKEANKITTTLQPTPAKSVNIEKTLNDLADNYSKLNNVNKSFAHNITQYSNYQRVYFKNDIGVFLLRVKNSSGKFISGKFAIYDYASKSELIAPTIIDDFDGGESKHFKILNNNLFYTSEKGDTEYLNYIDLSTENTIQNPHLEIYNDYDMEIVPYYSGSDEVLIIQHNANGGGTKKIAFDVANKKVIFDFNKNAHGYDHLLFRISQNKKTFYFNKKNGNYNDVRIYEHNGNITLITDVISNVYRIRGTKTFKEAFINNKLVKNVTLSILETSPRKILIIYEENGQLKHEVVEYTNPDNWSILKNEKFYLHETKDDVATWVFKNKDFIYISTKTNKATLGQKSTAISNKLAFVRVKQELMDLIVQSFVDYQKRIQKWLYEKYFILYNGLKSPQGMIKSGIQVKIDEDKIRNSLLKTFNNYDFTQINVKDSDETYTLDLDLDKLSNFMSVTYKDIAGNVSKKQNIDFNNKDDQGKSKKTWELTLYKNWEDIYNRVNKIFQKKVNNKNAFDYRSFIPFDSFFTPNQKIHFTKKRYYETLVKGIQNNLKNVIKADMGSFPKLTSYQLCFKLIINSHEIIIYPNSKVNDVVNEIIKDEGTTRSLFNDMIANAGTQNLTKKNLNLQMKFSGYFELSFKKSTAHKQSFTNNQKITLDKISKGVKKDKLIYNFGNPSDILKVSNNNTAVLFIKNSKYYIYDISKDKEIEVKNKNFINGKSKISWLYFEYNDNNDFKIIYTEENKNKVKANLSDQSVVLLGDIQVRDKQGLVLFEKNTSKNTVLDLKTGKWEHLADHNVKLNIKRFDFSTLSNLLLVAENPKNNNLIRYTDGTASRNWKTLGGIQAKSSTGDGFLLYDFSYGKHNVIYDINDNKIYQLVQFKSTPNKHKIIHFEYSSKTHFQLIFWNTNKLKTNLGALYKYENDFNLKKLGTIISASYVNKKLTGILYYSKSAGVYSNFIYDVIRNEIKKVTNLMGELEIKKFDFTSFSNLIIVGKVLSSSNLPKGDLIRVQNDFNSPTENLGHVQKESGNGIMLFKELSTSTGKYKIGKNYIYDISVNQRKEIKINPNFLTLRHTIEMIPKFFVYTDFTNFESVVLYGRLLVRNKNELIGTKSEDKLGRFLMENKKGILVQKDKMDAPYLDKDNNGNITISGIGKDRGLRIYDFEINKIANEMGSSINDFEHSAPIRYDTDIMKFIYNGKDNFDLIIGDSAAKYYMFKDGFLRSNAKIFAEYVDEVNGFLIMKSNNGYKILDIATGKQFDRNNRLAANARIIYAGYDPEYIKQHSNDSGYKKSDSFFMTALITINNIEYLYKYNPKNGGIKSLGEVIKRDGKAFLLYSNTNKNYIFDVDTNKAIKFVSARRSSIRLGWTFTYENDNKWNPRDVLIFSFTNPNNFNLIAKANQMTLWNMKTGRTSIFGTLNNDFFSYSRKNSVEEFKLLGKKLIVKTFLKGNNKQINIFKVFTGIKGNISMAQDLSVILTKDLSHIYSYDTNYWEGIKDSNDNYTMDNLRVFVDEKTGKFFMAYGKKDDTLYHRKTQLFYNGGTRILEHVRDDIIFKQIHGTLDWAAIQVNGDFIDLLYLPIENKNASIVKHRMLTQIKRGDKGWPGSGTISEPDTLYNLYWSSSFKIGMNKGVIYVDYDVFNRCKSLTLGVCSGGRTVHKLFQFQRINSNY